MSLETLYDDSIAIHHFNNNWLDAKGNHDISNTGGILDDSYPKLGSHNGKWDGLNDFGAIADNADFDTTERSLSFWGYIPDLSGAYCGILKHNSTAKTGWLFLVAGGIAYYRGGDGTTSPWNVYDANYALTSTGWHHFVCVHTGSVHNLYVDGYLRASDTGGTNPAFAHDVWYGRNCDPGQEGTYYESEIDEDNYWTRQITDGGVSVGQLAGGEVAELWNGDEGVQLGISDAASKVAGMFGLGKMGLR